MQRQRGKEKRYRVSEDVVARQIQEEFIIVPVTAVIEEDKDALFSLNETGKAIWERLDGTRSLPQIAQALSKEYDAPLKDIEASVQGFTKELLRRKMLVEVKK